jgi:outer membrane lipoprotein-sorting protein
LTGAILDPPNVNVSPTKDLAMFRYTLLAAMLPLVTGLANAAPAIQDDQDKARAILQKAVKALGGEERIGKLFGFTLKSRIKSTTSVQAIETTEQLSVQLPDRARVVTERESRGVKSTTTKVYNGNGGWQIVGGRVLDLPRTNLNQARNTLLGDFIFWDLAAFLKDRSYNLTPLGESRVDEKTVMGLKVSRDGDPEIRLYFDKKTGLLLKREAISAVNPASRSAVRQNITSVLFEEYQETAGIKIPFKTSTFRDGKRTSEKEVLEFKAVDKFDEATFAKP